MKRIVDHLRRTFITGLFVVIPVGITIFILKFLFNLATNVLGTQLLLWWDKLLSRITLVKSIYNSSKQLTKVFSEGKTSYRRAVFVEWPRPGVRAIPIISFSCDISFVVLLYSFVWLMSKWPGLVINELTDSK